MNKITYQVRIHPTRRVHPNSQDKSSNGIAPKGTQDASKTPMEIHGEFGGASEADLLVPCMLSI
jgi:hypothetical protein